MVSGPGDCISPSSFPLMTSNNANDTAQRDEKPEVGSHCQQATPSAAKAGAHTTCHLGRCRTLIDAAAVSRLMMRSSERYEQDTLLAVCSTGCLLGPLLGAAFGPTTRVGRRRCEERHGNYAAFGRHNPAWTPHATVDGLATVRSAPAIEGGAAAAPPGGTRAPFPGGTTAAGVATSGIMGSQ